MTCGEAIYSEYKNAMPQVVEDYMAEIGEIIERYGGTTACENKLTLLHVQYYKAAELLGLVMLQKVLMIIGMKIIKIGILDCLDVFGMKH